jgi:Asp-tRNA(Asn)/Glu-tRNA(Gln) amidotransferase B subunit
MYSDGGFVSHIKSDGHSIAMTAWTDFISMTRKGTSIAQMVSEAYLKQVAENRLYIQSLGEILLLIETQDIAQRRHREDQSSQNKGNFIKILNLVALIQLL